MTKLMKTWKLYCCLLLILLAILYVPAYYVLVTRHHYKIANPSDPYELSFHHAPSYRVGGELAVILFSPMHAIDVDRRRSYWRLSADRMKELREPMPLTLP